MDKIRIERRGSFLYAMAYRRVVVVVTLGFALAGALLGVAAATSTDNRLPLVLGSMLAISLIGITWFAYLVVLWVFSREARQAVEVGDEGIREIHGKREVAFIPWKGVTQVELAATVIAGASIRVKSTFSEIFISNVDMVITRPASLVEMHRAVEDTARLRELLDRIRSCAPGAAFSLNRLARRRMKGYAPAENHPA
ncbi:MAG TPA: hypothetical protein VJQ56_11640 [Blastocatellia bacterium]|nr:hypothetical protein [Blastocatellia bacterium]